MQNYQLIAILIAAIVLNACSDSSDTPRADFVPPEFPNPLITDVFADPHVLRYEDVYYMYGTSAVTDHYHVYTSTDMYSWERGPDIFDIGSKNMWAPDVHYDESTGLFYLWYTADCRIGLAIGTSPLGPFEDQGIKIDDAIDAFLFKDTNGDWYLYYTAVTRPIKSPVNGKLWVQPMLTPSIFKDVPPTLMLEPDQPWEILPGWAEATEAPWVFEHEGTYYLMYSGNTTGYIHYAIGYATANSPMGPWTKSPDNPILSLADGLSGPGHNSIVTGPDGNQYIFYHQNNNYLFDDYERYPAIDRFMINDDGTLAATATPLSTLCSTEECYEEPPVQPSPQDPVANSTFSTIGRTTTCSKLFNCVEN